MVIGGGKVGYYLVKTLVKQHHQVRLIELDQDRCNSIAKELGIFVMNADGTNIQDLEDAGIEDSDVVVAVTGKDEVNLAICQLAKIKFGIQKVIARVNNPKNERVFKELGVGKAVSSTSLIANMIENELVAGKLKTLLTFDSGDMTIVEADIDDDSKLVGKKIRDISFPGDCIIVSIIRDGSVIFPKGDSQIMPHDRLLALTSVKNKEQLEELFKDKRCNVKWYFLEP
ncbi:potassium channel family protein [Caldanaerobius fijiensis]|nr:NAD-binding protein [Caldanaerobius fijiensis]